MGIFKDTYHNHNHHTSVRTTNKITVNVPEQNPADAARYADESKELAEKRILAQISVRDNNLNIEGVFFSLGMVAQDAMLYTKFSFNGKEYVYNEKVDMRGHDDMHSPQTHAELVRKLVDKVADKIRDELCKAALDSMLEGHKQGHHR